MFWEPSSCRTLSLKSLYSILDHGDPILFPHGQQRFYAHPKVAFLAWKASWEKILTLEQVKRRGFSLVNRCFLCQRNEETIDHILLHCEKTWILWQLTFSLSGVSWVLPILSQGDMVLL